MQMLSRLAQRLGIFVASLLGASLLIFAVTNALPGDVAQTIMGIDAQPADVAALREQLGLNRPWLVQYVDWLSGLFTGNLGNSMISGDSVMSLLAPRIAVTAWVVFFGMVGSLVIAVPAGMIAALKRRSWAGTTVSASAQVGMAIPVFWGGILLTMVFAVWLRWLPANGYVPLTEDPAGWISHMVLPAVTLALVQAAVLIRYVRSSFLEVLSEDYYRTARAVGWTPMRALLRHGLRNAAIPLVTILGLQASSVLVGAIVVESVFNLPGLGSLLLSSVQQHDLPVVQGVVMFLVLTVLLISTLVDLAYVLIDPRQRVAQEAE